MASGDMTDGIGHRDHAEPERQRHPEQTDTNLWKPRGDHSAAATRKCQPKRTDRFGGIFLRIHYRDPPDWRLTISKQSKADFVDHQFTKRRGRQVCRIAKTLCSNHCGSAVTIRFGCR
jgi:hypothetical protein